MLFLYSLEALINLLSFFFSSFTDATTFSKLDLISNQQRKFSRIEKSISLKLERIIDSVKINIGFRLPV